MVRLQSHSSLAGATLRWTTVRDEPKSPLGPDLHGEGVRRRELVPAGTHSVTPAARRGGDDDTRFTRSREAERVALAL